MPIFCLNIQNVRRGAGRSSVGAAAYGARARLYDERSGFAYDFTAAAGELIHAEVMLQENGLFGEGLSREEVWNASEALNEGDNALLAWEVEGVVPGDLSDEDGVSAVRAFVESELLGRVAVAVDFSLHRAPDADGREQMFAYVRLVVLGEESSWLWPERLGKWRKHWAQCVNQRLISAGRDTLLDSGSKGARGRGLELDIRAEGAAAVELQWRNGERIKAEPDLVVKHLLRGRDGFTRKELASVVRGLTAGEAQYKKALHRVESLPGIVRLGESETGEELFGLRGAAQHKAPPDDAAIDRSGAADVSALLRAAVGGWADAGLRVRGVGLTYDRAKRFEKATGIPTAAVHGILGRWKKKKDLLESRDVLVVNDVGELSDRQKEWMLKAVRREKAKMAVVTSGEFILIDGADVGLDERQTAAMAWTA